MKDFKYILEPYKGMKTRHRCPKCNKSGVFTLYVDAQTGEPLSQSVGRCDREVTCGYHYKPKEYFADNPTNYGPGKDIGLSVRAYGKRKSFLTSSKNIPLSTARVQPSFIPAEVFKASLKGYEGNHLITYLVTLFGETKTEKLIAKYFIGSSKHWPGSTVFWQIDGEGRVRAGKIMLYDSETGKRVKKPFNHITWVHKAINIESYTLSQSLFGAHLLKDKSMPVAIVESEKTAIIASEYLPEFIWLASGSLSNLTPERCEVLRGRKVVLFPDLKATEKWQQKAQDLKSIAKVVVSDLLEKKATEEQKEQGLDLADFLVQLNLKDTPTEIDQKIGAAPVKEHVAINWQKFETPAKTYSNEWAAEVAELKAFFDSVTLPKLLRLNNCSTITDLPHFLDNHLRTAQANDSKRVFLPYLERLRDVKHLLIGGNLLTGTRPREKRV